MVCPAFAVFVSVLILSALSPNPAGNSQFEDITAHAKLTFINEASHTSRKYLPETMGGGVAMLDYNNDGFLDLFFVNGAALLDPMPVGKLPDKSDPKYWN